MAPEYQVLDDTAYIDMGTMDMNTHLTGDNYDLQSSVVTASNPIGEWNQARILVDGTHVEHWLNGQKTVEYEFFSPEWEASGGEEQVRPLSHTMDEPWRDVSPSRTTATRSATGTSRSGPSERSHFHEP